MKYVIKPELQKLTGSSASSAAAEWPLANLFDSHPRNWWKGTTNTATLRLKIDLGSSGLGLFSTNADTVTCTITRDANEKNLNAAPATDEGGGLVGIPVTAHGYAAGASVLFNGTTYYDGVKTVHASSTVNKIVITATYTAKTFAGTETVAAVQATQSFDLQVIDDYLKLVTGEASVYRQFFMRYTYQNVACTATISLASVAGTVVRAGVFKAGTVLTFLSPDYGLEEGKKDYSIVQETNNGAVYIKRRNILRTFSGQICLEREVAFHQFMNLYDYYGPTPFACLLTEVDDRMWAVYARFNGPPRASHAFPQDTTVSYSLEEVI